MNEDKYKVGDLLYGIRWANTSRRAWSRRMSQATSFLSSYPSLPPVELSAVLVLKVHKTRLTVEDMFPRPLINPEDWKAIMVAGDAEDKARKILFPNGLSDLGTRRLFSPPRLINPGARSARHRVWGEAVLDFHRRAAWLADVTEKQAAEAKRCLEFLEGSQ